jgi:hypothetical protein
MSDPVSLSMSIDPFFQEVQELTSQPKQEECHHRWQPFDHPDGEECEGCDIPATETHPVQICQYCGTLLCDTCRPLWPVGI